MTPALSSDEIVTEVRLRYWPGGHGFAFEEFARRHGDFAIAALAVLLTVDGEGRVDRASVTVAGSAPIQKRVAAAEEVLVGQAPTGEVLQRVALACSSLETASDAYYTAAYRKHLLGRLALRAVSRALARANGRDRLS